MTAQEAKAIALEFNSSNAHRALTEARLCVEAAAKRGCYTAMTYSRLPHDSKLILESEGFRIREWETQHDGYACEIDWK